MTDPAQIQMLDDTSVDLEQKVADLDKVDKPKLEEVAPVEGITDISTVPEDRYKNLQAAFTRASQENANLKSDMTQLQNQVEQLTTIQTNQQQQQVTEPTQTDYTDLDKSASEFEEMLPMVNHIKKLEQTILELQNKQATTEQSVAETQQQSSQTAQASAQEMHNQRILAVHPDAFNIANTVDFNGLFSICLIIVTSPP